ncbi:uncharacterized protein Smp_203370 [Schistosoma mansoni]|uniref:uncharacterized protein n=1 Tax=Schistosoma mansoni TaxID=6183 RepID=UPI00022DC673|nr:uncharacterized protein Smp_203370 [Schistosoma mansoni]|eukprot:XP_018653871.1 uncharacterized protein Smp_203370 [Schistosoma mansoni]
MYLTLSYCLPQCTMFTTRREMWGKFIVVRIRQSASLNHLTIRIRSMGDGRPSRQ